MEYIRTPVSLFPNRLEILEKDFLDIIQNANYSSYESFKQYWKLNNLSMIHHSRNEKETKDEFYQSI